MQRAARDGGSRLQLLIDLHHVQRDFAEMAVVNAHTTRDRNGRVTGTQHPCSILLLYVSADENADGFSRAL